MNSGELSKSYESDGVEQRWYDVWEREKLFAADETGDSGPPYSIVIPPPNVTGMLHMGHALNVTLQDILCRYRRLCGDNVLWVPGTDHAGIATQNVVEKKLAAEGTDRNALGREKFIERVWAWRKEYGGTIIRQLKRLGASCDWDRERFTMDEGLSRAVRTVFVRLYEEGLIYRGEYLTNWCPRCHTAISDIEVTYEEQKGALYHVSYPLEDGSGHIVVATTRPETMLGDTAVAVNPKDGRYEGVAGKRVVLPLTGRTIPVIEDTYVDMSFGTGALKITPAHDPNDFEIGRNHGLEIVRVIDDRGFMTEEAGRFAGLERFECRKAVVEALEGEGLLLKVEDYVHSVGTCYRCNTVIEPNLSTQWFVKVKPLAARAVEAVEKGETRIIPESWTKTYYEWMRNIRDWCISRQIWWGHRIPAWHCGACGEVIVAKDDPSKCPFCGAMDIKQDEDVLDTWFSSALWPFSTMGWPEKTPLLERFYPTNVLVTGFDILFFWVARMLMMGLHFMGQVPFSDVYIHALVRDETGRKMSKSTGNVIDPIDLINRYGADALRFTLAAFAAQGRDIKLSESRVEGYRHFINKLWNAARFCMMHIEKGYDNAPADGLTLAGRWILSRLDNARQSVAEALDSYRFNDAATALYQFVWHEFCDWYLEAAKPDLYGKNGDERMESSRHVLWFVLRNTLVMLHPFIPFVTEEIWNVMPGTEGFIMKADFPAARDRDPGAEKEMNLIMDVVTGIRNIRGEMDISPSKRLEALVHAGDNNTRMLIDANRDMIMNLARLCAFSVESPGEKPAHAATSVAGDAVIYVLLEGVIDFVQEKARIEKEMARVLKEIDGVSGKLANEQFLCKAPQAVIEKARQTHSELLEKKKKLEAALETVEKFLTA